MANSLSNTIHGVIEFTWPMILISMIILVSIRVCYIFKNHKHIILYQELLMMAFIIYILCLFQIVTFQDDINWSSNNFIPFKEIFRYSFGSRLFLKNILGNILLFFPFGFFVSTYLKSDKYTLPLILTIIASSSIEVVQMVIGRVFDIDDILLNILGGVLGYFLYYWLQQISNYLPKFFHKEIFLNILAIAILIGLILLLV